MLRPRKVIQAIMLAASLAAAAVVSPAHAETPFVEFAAKQGNFPIVQGTNAAVVYVDVGDWPGVARAANDLKEDIQRVTGKLPTLARQQADIGRSAIIVGTAGRSPLIDQLARAGKIDLKPIEGKWEASLTQVVANPFPGVESALVIAGSDKRGTIFGIYELSRQIGVSPWHWFADVPAIKHAELFVKPGTYLSGEPAVKYRGIFINDEAPALSGMVHEKFGGYTSKFYAHVFELLLRNKANYLWPAMWLNRTGITEPSTAFNEDDPENPRLADEMGIVMGTSHHEPMMRSHYEWKKHQNGAWNYQTNAAGLQQFWSFGMERNKNFENMVTLGMRGDGDSAIPSAGSPDATARLLERMVADQRRIIAEKVNPDVTKVPQVWCLYKEVQGFYENNGMRVPDDVTLLWCDDNYGNIRRLPTPEERNRAGGAGMYYHFDYVGSPRNYKWLNTNPLPRVWEQMTQTLEFGADRIWIVNVGDIKPMEFPMSFFLEHAWAGKKMDRTALDAFPEKWAAQQFGPQHAKKIGDLLSRYGKYAGRRKPELIDANTFSLVNYNESDTIIAEYKAIVTEAEAIAKSLPPETQDAFFQLVIHQPKAMSIFTELFAAQAKNRLYLQQQRASANDFAQRVRDLYEEDNKLVAYYNKTMSGGKWNKMADQAHYGYTGWQEPRPVQIMPAVNTFEPPAGTGLGVAVEGNAATLAPGAKGTLPPIDVFQQQRRWIDIFNTGKTAFNFSATTSEPWLQISKTQGTIEKEERLWLSVDWSKAPRGTATGTVTVKGPEGAGAEVQVSAFNPADVTRENLKGYVESEGVVSIAPQKFSKMTPAGNVRWEEIKDFGRFASGMTVFPMTAESVTPPDKSPVLEYQVYLFTAGNAEVLTMIAPTLAYGGHGVRLAVSMDDAPPQIIDAVGRGQGTDNLPADWSQAVSNNVRTVRSTHAIATPGYHTLKIWMVDPGVVIEKIVVNMGGLRPSYLGPPESFRGTAQ